MRFSAHQKITLTLLVLAAGGLLWPYWLNQGMEGGLAVRVITAESANQNLWTMVGVGEVIRHRGAIYGFTVLKKDLGNFYSRQKPGVRRRAQTAWLLSRLTNLTQGATHFENVKQFGPPPWEHEMRKTVRLQDLQFYKRSNA